MPPVRRPSRSLLRAALLLALANLFRRARRTRPEPLPPPPRGSRTVTCPDGTRLHAQVGGVADSDVTLVFVHGLLARTIEFDMQWVAFSDAARLVRYDHRNHGRSDRSRSRVSIDTLADDLACVITQLVPVGQVVLVGHSLGGMTILAFARRHPELLARVSGACLLATRAGHYVEGHPYENTMRWAARRHALDLPLQTVRLLAPLLERFRPRRTRLARTLTRRFLFGDADADPATLAMVQELLEEPPLSVLSTLDLSVLRHDAIDGLRALAGRPVAVISGDGDHLSWAEHAERMASELGQRVDMTVLPGVGHALNQTRPVEVNAAIRRVVESSTVRSR